jgi:hypothetical protein
MKQQLSPGAIAGIIAVTLVVVGGLFMYFYNTNMNPPPPPIPMKPGGSAPLTLPGGNSAPSPTGAMKGPSLPGAPGGGMTAPPTP